MKSSLNGLKYLIAILLLMFYSCAQQIPPDGGLRDEIAPKIVGSKPLNETKKFNSKKIEIEFDEYIQIKENKNIIISPKPKLKPNILVNGKKVEIEFQEKALDSNTTYIINFSNAIADIHEGKILESYKYALTTGEHLDSNSIDGIVIDAETNEPQKEITVGLSIWEENKDSIFFKKSISYISRTNEQGNYSITNLPNKKFELFAFKDINNNNQLDKSEPIGFIDSCLEIGTKEYGQIKIKLFKQPEHETDKLLDTLHNQIGIYKFIIYNYKYTKINLNNSLSNSYIKVIKHPEGFDTLVAYTHILKDSNISNTFIRTVDDKVDTFSIQGARSKNKKFEAPEFKINPPTKPSDSVVISSRTPIQKINISSIKLKKDTIQLDSLKLIKIDAFNYYLKNKLETDYAYQFNISDSAFETIYGQYNKAINQLISIPKEENFGGILITNTIQKDSNLLIQLVEKSDPKKVVYSTRLNKELISIKHVKPGIYLLRIVKDSNKNTIWDNGNILYKLQAEPIKYLNNEITIKAYWDIEILLTKDDFIFN